jgi:AcrR family transcriptional regulator
MVLGSSGELFGEVAVPSGKLGRPAEDRLVRQREIYVAVAPLILSRGARALSLRDAARAACISVGGLYHYFPTKRDLLLHGLRWDARDRLCRDYRASIADLAGWSLGKYLDLYLDHSLKMFAFIRPSILAAMELGAAELQAGLDSGLAANVGELVESLRHVAPGLTQTELEALGRAIRRVILGALIDRNTDLAETRAQLRMLIGAAALGAPGSQSQAGALPPEGAMNRPPTDDGAVGARFIAPRSAG